MHLDLRAIARATGGSVLGAEDLADGVADGAADVVVDGATIDSREVRPGQLFVPIVAERDGHDFIDAALRAGAAAYLTMRDDRSGRAAVHVADTAAALSALGHLARERIAARVVGVTGSVGKTSTKDLLSGVLATGLVTSANRASFNNELGVPLTLLEAPDDVEALVCEMGARGIGHIAQLCAVARPTIGVVTAVQGAHLEQFGSLEAVALAKSELIAALPEGGTAVLNADQDLVAAMTERTVASVVRVGLGDGATPGRDLEVTASSITLDDALRARFELESAWGNATVRLGVRGAHQVTNALCAAAVGLVSGIAPDVVAEGLGTEVISPMRMALARRADGLVVLDDSYNANPTSMAAALDALATLEATRRFAVVGYMAELGIDEVPGHRSVAEQARAAGIELIAVGTECYGPDVPVAADIDAALAALEDQGVGVGDAVLVKASRVVGLDRLAAALLAHP